MCKTMQKATDTPPHCQHRPSEVAPPSTTNRHPVHRRTMPTPHWILQVLLIIALFSSAHALLGSDDEQAVEFNNERDASAKSRLATLLQLKRSIKALMQQREDLIQPDDSIEDSTIDTIGENDITTDKRVFCNGFTGCGGRFRERSAQQRAREATRKRMENAKRPFCNTNGCFNGGKRKRDRSSKVVLDGETYIINDGRLTKTFSGTEPAPSSEGSSRDKRLFCNGYGGCQNMSKRRYLIDVLAGNPSRAYNANKASEHVYDIAVDPTKEKRFYASSFDSKMDDFLSRIDGSR